MGGVLHDGNVFEGLVDFLAEKRVRAKYVLKYQKTGIFLSFGVVRKSLICNALKLKLHFCEPSTLISFSLNIKKTCVIKSSLLSKGRHGIQSHLCWICPALRIERSVDW
jgi:hypothetical protein